MKEICHIYSHADNTYSLASDLGRSVEKVGCGAVFGVGGGCGKEVMKCEHP